MARTGGDKTKKRILEVAEKLFSTTGFDGTSVDQIARTAEVNKALIYYHFKNKNDLILSLFENIIEQVAEHVEQKASNWPEGGGNIRKAIKEEIAYLAGRREILSVMLAEALRSNCRENYLFRCAELVIQKEHGEAIIQKSGPVRRASRAAIVHEFFTGFIPLVAFVVLQDKWCKHFKYERSQVMEDFVDSFARSHLASSKSEQDWKR